MDGELIGAKKKPIYIALNKPAGITCTTESHVKDNIVDFIGHAERIFPVGRLDKDSEGLILLTNDGDIVNEILRSENEHEKEYLVGLNRPITDLSLSMLASGVKIMGVMTKTLQGDPRRARWFAHHSDPRIEPADPPDVFRARLPGRTAAAGADHQHRSGRSADGRVALPLGAGSRRSDGRRDQVERSTGADTPSLHRRPVAVRQSGSCTRAANQRKKSSPPWLPVQ